MRLLVFALLFGVGAAITSRRLLTSRRSPATEEAVRQAKEAVRQAKQADDKAVRHYQALKDRATASEENMRHDAKEVAKRDFENARDKLDKAERVHDAAIKPCDTAEPDAAKKRITYTKRAVAKAKTERDVAKQAYETAKRAYFDMNPKFGFTQMETNLQNAMDVAEGNTKNAEHELDKAEQVHRAAIKPCDATELDAANKRIAQEKAAAVEEAARVKAAAVEEAARVKAAKEAQEEAARVKAACLNPANLAAGSPDAAACAKLGKEKAEAEAKAKVKAEKDEAEAKARAEKAKARAEKAKAEAKAEAKARADKAKDDKAKAECETCIATLSWKEKARMWKVGGKNVCARCVTEEKCASAPAATAASAAVVRRQAAEDAKHREKSRKQAEGRREEGKKRAFDAHMHPYMEVGDRIVAHGHRR